MRYRTLVAIAAVTLAAFVIGDADARVGGGKSMGVQRPSVTPRASTPPASTPSASTPSGAASQPVMPAQPGATVPGKSPAAAPSGASRWLGPLAGLAAGLGLGALLSHFGLSEGFGSLLLMVLLVVGVIIVVRMLLARNAPARR